MGLSCHCRYESDLHIKSAERIITSEYLLMDRAGEALHIQNRRPDLEKVIKITTLGWVNRLLGVLLSVSAVVLLIGVVISVIEYVNTTWFTIIPPEQMAKSKGVQIISSITDAVFPYLKQLFNT